jgi:hypothetical protein
MNQTSKYYAFEHRRCSCGHFFREHGGIDEDAFYHQGQVIQYDNCKFCGCEKFTNAQPKSRYLKWRSEA